MANEMSEKDALDILFHYTKGRPLFGDDGAHLARLCEALHTLERAGKLHALKVAQNVKAIGFVQ